MTKLPDDLLALIGHLKKLSGVGTRTAERFAFELLGWPETTVIIRFWIIQGACVATALALFIGDFTRLESLR